MENAALEYFTDFQEALPSLDDYKNWPISHEKVVNFKCDHFHENPKPMQPKNTPSEETHTDYYVSPRKFVRFYSNQGIGYTCADCFCIRGVCTFTQNPNGKTSITYEMNIEITKHINFLIKPTIMSESEKQCKITYTDKFKPKIEDILAKAYEEVSSKEKIRL